MTDLLAYAALIIFTASLLYILHFCLYQLVLLYQYIKSCGKMMDEKKNFFYPVVTIQLPLYNERFVVERLLEAVCKIQYPGDKLEIQILDDSTDDTSEILQSLISFYKEQGRQITYIKRESREGFKAGALAGGLEKAKGEYIAIFDADFIPDSSFLIRTIPKFLDPKTGAVQTRWQHLNEKYSLITRLQAFQLNVHFNIEQPARQSAHHFLQFNGTAGVWRKETIIDAGGWHADTLTEDLDLSYRAQMAGWKIHYDPRIGSPAELPAEMNSFKTQQYRWMKGGAETAKKIIPNLWKSDLALKKKVYGSLHLLSSSIFLFVLVAGIMSVPAMFAIHHLGVNENIYQIFLISTISIAIVYFIGQHEPCTGKGEKSLKNTARFTVIFPVFLSLSMGLSLHNSIAVLQGYSGKKTPFRRTPKFALEKKQRLLRKHPYFIQKLPWSTYLEGFIALYFLIGLISAFYYDSTYFVIYQLMLLLGFGTIFYYSVKHYALRQI